MKFTLLVCPFLSVLTLISGCATNKSGGEQNASGEVKTRMKNMFSFHTNGEHKAREKEEKEILMKKWAEEKAKKETTSKSTQSESMISTQSDSLLSTQPES